MANPYFQFKQFTVYQDRCAMKVTTDSCLFGAWVANNIRSEQRKIQKVLDVGSGTGLLSLMIAQKNDLKVDALEIDTEASMQSEENIAASLWKNRIHVMNVDVRQFTGESKYDCIISNPPFYETELTSETTTKNIAHHSQELTLPELLEAIKKNLQEGGVFYLLFPFKRANELKQLVREYGLYLHKIIIASQSVKHGPFRVMIKGGNADGQTEEESLSIWNMDQQYTEAFVELLKDYYLYL
jgi:tRNA1Val (adenine37-N6)-methyltransferase